jgi:plastocyanin
LIRFVSLVLVALVLAACGTGGSGSASAEPSTAASAAASVTTSGDAEGTVTVTAVDYAFSGIDAEVPAGTTFSFVNEGSELHEIAVVRRNEGVTESWEELLSMSEEETADLITIVGHLMAEPGEEAEGTLTVDEAGDYFAVCFVPMGVTSMDEMPDASAMGAPHFTAGMQMEFTVTD